MVVFEAEASGGSKAGGPHPSLSPFPPLHLSIPPKFSDKPVGGKVRSSEGQVPRLPPINTNLVIYAYSHHHHHIYFRLPERPQKPIELTTIKQLKENCKNEKNTKINK